MDFRRPKRNDIGIDMTPMIDCVFQLLIFFMLSSSFLTPNVRLDLPRASADKPEPPKDVVIVSVDASNHMFINKEPIAPAALRQRLLSLFAKNQNRAVILRADRTLAYEKVLEALVAIQQAGSTQVHLAHDEKTEPKP